MSHQLTREEAIERLEDAERQRHILEQRVDALTETVNALEAVLVGDVSASTYDELPIAERVTQLEATASIAATKADAVGETKTDLAYRIAQKEGVRVATKAAKSLSGGAVDWPTVRDIADREYNTELHSGTVYTAFDRLADDWECFEVKRGGDGPHTKNKVLRCHREDITAALRTAVTNRGN